MNKLPRTQFELVAAWLNIIVFLAMFGPILLMILLIMLGLWSIEEKILFVARWTPFAIPISTILLWFAKRRGRIQAENLDFKLCTNCRYPLEGHPATGRCSECGEPYNIEVAQMRWKNTYSDRQVKMRDWLPF